MGSVIESAYHCQTPTAAVASEITKDRIAGILPRKDTASDFEGQVPLSDVLLHWPTLLDKLLCLVRRGCLLPGLLEEVYEQFAPFFVVEADPRWNFWRQLRKIACLEWRMWPLKTICGVADQKEMRDTLSLIGRPRDPDPEVLSELVSQSKDLSAASVETVAPNKELYVTTLSYKVDERLLRAIPVNKIWEGAGQHSQNNRGFALSFSRLLGVCEFGQGLDGHFPMPRITVGKRDAAA
jgi:hypothetical protein